MNDSTPRPPQTIAVTSGKGGVGKSQLVAGLALALMREGRRVLLVDVDVGVGDLALLAGVEPEGDLGDVIAGPAKVADVVTEYARDFEGLVDLLAAPSAGKRGGELTPAEQLAIVEAVGEVGVNYDFVIIDTGAGVTANPMLFAAAADRVIVLTTPEPTAIFDAYAAIKVLHRAHRVVAVDLVVNSVGSRNEGPRAHRRLLGVVQGHLPVALRYLGALPEDDRVRRAVHRCTPAVVSYPQSDYARAVRRLAERLCSEEATVRAAGGIRYFAEGPSALGAVS